MENTTSMAKNKLVKIKYNGVEINLNEDGWFNATKAADLYGKRPVDWLKLKETKEYVDRLCTFRKVKQNHFIKTKRGKNISGTCLHPRLAVPFARWCDTDFAIWCDDQIDKILRGKHEHLGVGLTRDARRLALSKFVADFNMPMLEAAAV